jgi:hypothetical protein
MCYLETKVTIRKERILINKEILFTRLIHLFPFPQSSYPPYLFIFAIQL